MRGSGTNGTFSELPSYLLSIPQEISEKPRMQRTAAHRNKELSICKKSVIQQREAKDKPFAHAIAFFCARFWSFWLLSLNWRAVEDSNPRPEN